MDADGYRLATAIAPLLRAEREKAALTQTQLARRAATTQQHVSRLEAGRLAPTTALLDRLFEALGLQLHVTVEQRDADPDAGIDAAGGWEADL
jgi:transcriptional regulator with XRE-family HTH domain